MSVLVLLIVLSVCFALSALALFLWAQRNGQFDCLSGDDGGEGAQLPLSDGSDAFDSLSASLASRDSK